MNQRERRLHRGEIKENTHTHRGVTGALEKHYQACSHDDHHQEDGQDSALRSASDAVEGHHGPETLQIAAPPHACMAATPQAGEPGANGDQRVGLA